MNKYLAYGLNIHSDIALPALVSQTDEQQPNVVIQLSKVQPLASPTTQLGWNFHMTAEGDTAYCYWERVGKFLVRDGNEILADLDPEVNEAWVRLALLGMCMTVLLHQRGLLVLHGSAVAIDGTEAVVFLGGKGQGKSTLAAKLYKQGHRFISDDVIAVDLTNPITPMVIPSFPQLKLFPESAFTALGDDAEMLPRLGPGHEKRSRRVTERFSNTNVPLRCICMLDDGLSLGLNPLRPQEAITSLITHSYVTRFGDRLLQGSRGALHLKQCTKLLNNVPAYNFERPRSLDLLSAAAQLVTEHIRLRRQVVNSVLPESCHNSSEALTPLP